MNHNERNETNHGTAGKAAADASPKGGDSVMVGENGTWHADCFESAAREGSDIERDTNDTDKEKNTNDKDKVLLTDEEIDAGMTAHEGLVRHLAGRIAEGSGAKADDDLLQEGRMDLWEGLKRFDKARGNRQSTYVAWWIRRGILRELEKRRKYAAFFPASLKEIAARQGVSTTMVHKVLRRALAALRPPAPAA